MCHGIPLRGCITSGYGEISETNRILGPITNEAAKYYQIADWIGIILTNHPSIVLNNKVSINPQKELFEPYIKYEVSVKEGIPYNIRCEEYWSLRWPIPQGFERRDMGRSFAAVPSNIVPDEAIIQVIKNGMQHEDAAVAEKWKNTWNFFNSIK
jgi:hypothetical protein